MRPDKITVYDLFDRQRRYAVPLYQRPYVWTEQDQWIPLWDDVSERARLVQVGEAKGPHFLGAIVTSQRQVFGNEISAWELIDGQQRLTTLQIVLAAFSDVVRALGESRYDRDLQRITRNDGVMQNADERFKVWPTNSDRAAFTAVMDAGALEKLLETYPGLRGRHKRPAPKLAQAYAFFFRRIQEYIAAAEAADSPGSTSERVQALFETFRRYLQIVNIELESGDDPQVIFESLNGRGVPLLPSDLIRNFVFMKVSRAGARSDELYRQYWRAYDEGTRPGAEDDAPWWKQQERQGRITRPRLDLFLFHYLQYRTEQELNIGHLFQEFRGWWGDGAADPAGALADLQRHAEAFASWLDPKGDSRTSDVSRWLRTLDTSTVYPLMFLLLVEGRGAIEDAELIGILDDLESYLVRRAVCGLTNKQYNRFFVGLLRNLRKAERLDRETIRQHLGAGSGDSVRWPGDEEFGQAFLHRPVYRVLKREVIWRILFSLEHALTTAKHERVEILSKLSIEHILPQSWTDNKWPIQDDSDEGRERRERMLHTFGNLTLVTPEFNTALGNRSFLHKQKEFRKISRLLLNKPLTEAADWAEEAILARGRDLLDVARRRWPHPSSPAAIDDVALDYRPEGTWTRRDDDETPDEPPIEIVAAESLLDAFAAARRGVAAPA